MILWSLISISGLAAPTFHAGYAQTINPNHWVTNGEVRAIVSHEGTTYVGGNFTQVGPATGSAVPVDASSGTLPANFPKVGGTVYAVAGYATGWYLGGQFTSVGGQPRSNIAFVNSDLTVSSWNPGIDGPVYALHVPPFGTTLYVGGGFTQVAGVGRARLAAFDIATGSLTAWNPGAIGQVRALANWGTQIMIGGTFTSVAGVLRANLAAVDVSSGAATAFIADTNGDVHALAVTTRFIPDVGFFPSLYVGGTFTSCDGFTRNYIAELNSTGTLTSWNPNANGAIYAINTNFGSVWVGGDFTQIGGQARARAAQLEPGTAAVLAWNPSPNGTVRVLSAEGDGVYLGGSFTTIGGQPRNNLARVDGTAGLAHPWNPNIVGTVLGFSVNNPMYVVGSFTSAGPQQTRRNLAAFDVLTGQPKPWNPDANGPVNTLSLAFSGEQINSVYAGGTFTTIGGQTRNYIAAIEPDLFGALLPANPNANGEVRGIVVTGATAQVCGAFNNIGGEPRSSLAEIDVATGAATALIRDTAEGFAVEVQGDWTWVGGYQFLKAFRSDGSVAHDIDVNGTVLCLLFHNSSRLLVGGSFDAIDFVSRNNIAELQVSHVNSWNPNANGPVLSLASDNSTVYAGGDFTTVWFGQPRSRFAALDAIHGFATPWTADANGTVRAIAIDDWALFAGGSFTSIADQPQSHLALLESPHAPLPACTSNDLNSWAGPRPRSVTTGEFHNDGIQDLVVCNDWVVPGVSILRGVGSSGIGNGSFTATQSLPLDARPMQAVVADFDLDGYQDVAVSKSSTTGSVALYLNNAGTLQPASTIPLPGRCDGMATADLDLDGILDLAVCLTDSAGNSARGGVQVLLGGGQGGIWDGTFALGPKFNYPGEHVVVADFNQDGTPDMLLTGKASTTQVLQFGAPLTVACQELEVAYMFATGVATGDFNEDGKLDYAIGGYDAFSAGHQLRVLLNIATTGTPCTSGPWFTFGGLYNMPALSPPPRDLAALDFTQDGILDVVATYPDQGTIQLFPGIGDNGFWDVNFDDPVTLATSSVWGIAVGDFVGNGSPDVAFTKYHCDAVEIVPQAASPTLPTNLTLLSPNGGEIWPQATVQLEGGLPRLASVQSITWSKGAGVRGVDVEVSRDQGSSWRTIARNHPGTSMNWIVTAPGTQNARVRVRDHAVPSRSDASDANFEIPANPATDIAPDENLPMVAAFACVDHNPVQANVRFRMELPTAADANVEVFDVTGRRVKVLTRSRFSAGRHTIAWDTRDTRGARVARGVYFVRARCGDFEAKHKIVVLKSGD